MTAPLYSNVGPHHQGFDADLLIEVGGQNVRIRVHHDTSYPKQSRATAEVWTPAAGGGGSWNECATLMWQAWAHETARFNSGTVGLWEAVEELTARAHHLLDTATGAPMTKP